MTYKNTNIISPAEEDQDWYDGSHMLGGIFCWSAFSTVFFAFVYLLTKYSL